MSTQELPHCSVVVYKLYCINIIEGCGSQTCPKLSKPQIDLLDELVLVCYVTQKLGLR